MTADKAAGKIIIKSKDGYRYYTDALTETIVVPITTTKETAEIYYKLFILPAQNPTTNSSFDALPRVSMYVGPPDTGKTYKAQKIAEQFKVKKILKICRDTLTLETLVEDFILIDGKPVFQESLALQMMSGTEPGLIILDEFNTLLTGVMKTFQPIFDDTSTEFEYRGKVYKKNMNCKFIVTLNDKDKGISIVPDAILSRCHLQYFEPVNTNTISKWTGTKIEWVNNLYKLYEVLGLLGVFGTRQVKMLKNYTDIAQIKNHLYGLCAMKNIDTGALDTVQVQTFINKL